MGSSWKNYQRSLSLKHYLALFPLVILIFWVAKNASVVGVIRRRKPPQDPTLTTYRMHLDSRFRLFEPDSLDFHRVRARSATRTLCLFRLEGCAGEPRLLPDDGPSRPGRFHIRL